MYITDHLNVDKQILGKEYPQVHKWLDACFPDYLSTGKYSGFGHVHYHHIERHHLEAISKKYAKGTPEYTSACLHVLVDMVSHYGKAVVPMNRQECLEIIDSFFGVERK